jgi:hypothetical protein
MDNHDEPMHPDDAEPLEVPWTALSREALLGVVEAFVLREGTDYGDREVPHAEKVRQVLAGLERGEVRMLFDPASQSATLQPHPPGASRR